jgi:hypothetical protein
MLTQIFCEVDDFCQQFESEWKGKMISYGEKQRSKPSTLTLSEIMTIEFFFHISRYRDFKHYYLEYVIPRLQGAFPNLVSYNRFVELKSQLLLPLTVFLKRHRLGQCSGISYIDSTTLHVCHNKRIHNHKVFDGLAERGKTSMGWFYGFKLHLITSEQGELINLAITPGNVDDRDPKVIDKLTHKIFGKLFGDKGYLSQKLFEELLEKGVTLITRVKKNMKNRLLSLMDKLLLRKRAIIETINDQLKNISQIEHTRHRSPINAFVNVIAGLIAYSYQEKKPSIGLTYDERSLLEGRFVTL